MNIKKSLKFDLAYLSFLFVSLSVVYWQSLFFPPLSDYWEMFYSFHHLNRYPGDIKWLHIFNFDPIEQVGFRPLAHFFYYLLHLLFGSNFVYFNLVNFLFYFLNISLLYRWARILTHDKLLPAVFIYCYAFLLANFNIVLWSCHIHIIIGFILFICGIMALAGYFKKKNSFLVVLAAVCFFLGMLCYEPFFFWPFIIFVFSPLIYSFPKNCPSKIKKKKIGILSLTAVYAGYFITYFFLKSLGTYKNPLHTFSDFIKIKYFLLAVPVVFSNLFFSGLFVNSIPFLVFPLTVAENIYSGGYLLKFLNLSSNIILVSGLLVMAAAAFILHYLYREKYRPELKMTFFFIMMMFSALYIISLAKLNIDSFTAVFKELRYQYIPNAFIFLILIIFLNRVVKLSKKGKRIVYTLVFIVFFINIMAVLDVSRLYANQVEKLKRIISQIKQGINKGLIDSSNKVYIDKDIHDYLPSLCWNIEMGERFIKKGTYRWLFSEDKIKFFADDIQNAEWAIDSKSFGLIKKDSYTPGRGEKISKGKIDQYLNLISFYRQQGKNSAVKKNIKKLKELAPDSDKALDAIAAYYAACGKKEKAKSIYKKAAAINPGNKVVLTNLGHLYNDCSQYEKAEHCFKKVIKDNPSCADAYRGLAISYKNQEGKSKLAEHFFLMALHFSPGDDNILTDAGHYYNQSPDKKKAERMFKKALRINPENASAYDGLAAYYKHIGKLGEAVQMYEKALELGLENMDIYLNLAECYRLLGRKEDETEIRLKIKELRRN